MLFNPFPLFQKLLAPAPIPGPSIAASIRRFTTQQFSELTAIVGSQLDRAIADLLTRYNALLAQDLGNRWIEQKYVFGFTPCNSTFTCFLNQVDQPSLPFVGIHNANAQIALDATAQNPYRLRGTFNPGDNPNAGDGTDNDILAWTNALHFTNRARIIGVNLVLVSGEQNTNNSQNPWVYGPSAPPTKQPAEPLDDFYLDLSVDSQFAKNNSRWLAETEIQRHRWNAKQFACNPQPRTLGGSPLNMEPHYGPFDAAIEDVLSIDARNLSIPVMPGNVVRLAFSIPFYDGNDSGWNHASSNPSDKNLPWANQVYSLTLTTLEPIK